MSHDEKPDAEPERAADRIASDDPKKTQKLTQADDDFDPNEGQK